MISPATLHTMLSTFPAVNLTLLVALITLFVKNKLDHRKLTIEENAGLRKEFIEEMHALRSEVQTLRSENASLRREVSELHGIIEGLSRRQSAEALSTQRAIVDVLPGVSTAVREAAHRAEEANKGKAA